MPFPYGETMPDLEGHAFSHAGTMPDLKSHALSQWRDHA